MWEAINSFLTKVDDFVWGPPLMILIIAGGILLTIRMGVLQVVHSVRHFQRRSEPEILSALQQRSEPVARVLCSGWCLQHSSEWQPSMQRDSLQLSIVW